MEINNEIKPEISTELPIRSYAFIGDAVYELFIREKTVFLAAKPEILHKLTSSLVKAEFHAELFEKIQDFLNENEKTITRRARNLSVTTARRTNQAIHRLSTALEALVGYLYIHDKERLNALYSYIEPFIDEKLSVF